MILDRALSLSAALVLAGCFASETPARRSAGGSPSSEQSDPTCDEVPSCDLVLTDPFPPSADIPFSSGSFERLFAASESGDVLHWVDVQSRPECTECPQPFQIRLRDGDGSTTVVPTAFGSDELGWVADGTAVMVTGTEELTSDGEERRSIALRRASDAATLLHIELNRTLHDAFAREILGLTLSRDDAPACAYLDIGPHCTFRYLVDNLSVVAESERVHLAPGEQTDLTPAGIPYAVHHHISEHHARELGSCGDTGCAPYLLDSHAFELARTGP
jgi:hypothetical protein